MPRSSPSSHSQYPERRVDEISIAAEANSGRDWFQLAHNARRRTDLAPVHQPVVIDVIEGDLLPMRVQAAYHCPRDLLELLKHFSDA